LQPLRLTIFFQKNRHPQGDLLHGDFLLGELNILRAYLTANALWGQALAQLPHPTHLAESYRTWMLMNPSFFFVIAWVGQDLTTGQKGDLSHLVSLKMAIPLPL
jgi:hypothetical protein